MSGLPCGTSEDALWDLAEGTASGARPELLDHVDACAMCQERLAELRQLYAGLASIGTAESAAMPETIGPYRIVRLIGEGGMGAVYEAEQTSPERRVALK